MTTLWYDLRNGLKSLNLWISY